MTACDLMNKPTVKTMAPSMDFSSELVQISDPHDFSIKHEDNLVGIKKFLLYYQSEFSHVSQSLNDSESLSEIKDKIYPYREIIEKTLDKFRNLKNLFLFDSLIHKREDHVNHIMLFNKIDNMEFVPVKTKGDGNCLFRAISLVMLGSEDFYKILRICASFTVLENFQYFEEICEFELESYLKEMVKDKSFAGETEEMSISHIFARPILNLSLQSTLEFFSEKEQLRFELEPIKIIFDPLNKHFTALLPKDQYFTLKRPRFCVFEKRIIP